MDNESIKIKIQDQDEISGTEKLNKNENNVKGGNDMENENKTVLNDYNDERLANIGIEEEMDLFFIFTCFRCNDSIISIFHAPF